ncbi:37s ribosomal protein rsm22 [Colletotrichum sojae]|uniref:37s ribosomal protein rsm22 n=1 Tax=Colletotrichum sojae TaxID=2175907 RepID=A0A8H6IQ83_9PEZI|nr:37s ribosomal protein rsm22 [Colletotrichum sojae]
MLTAGGLRNACPSCRARLISWTGAVAGASLSTRPVHRSSYSRQSSLAASQLVARPAARRTLTTTTRRLGDSDPKRTDVEDASSAADIETVVREAKQRFRDTLPKGYLTEEEYRLYERWYGPPLRETSPEDVGIKYLNEERSEARVRRDGSAEPALLRELEGGGLEEILYARKGMSQPKAGEEVEVTEEEFNEEDITEEELLELSAQVESAELAEAEESDGPKNYINIVARNQREYDALMKLQRDFEANAREVEAAERARAQQEEEEYDEEREPEEQEEELDEDDDGIMDQGLSKRSGRLHPFTREGHFSTNPSTVDLPYAGYIYPVTTLLGRTDLKHVRIAAEAAFGGPGLPYSPATPASKMNLPQQPLGMAVWQNKMSDIEADAFVSTFLPPVYASAMGSLVEVRKRLGSGWLRGMFERGEGDGPRVLDAGAGGAGILAWQDVVRAEWEALKASGEVTGQGPHGKKSVVIGSERLRHRISKFLQNTTFLPRLPDYAHSVDNHHRHIDANQVAQPRKMYDVIIASHLLLPVKEGHRRKAIVNNLWSLLNPDGGVLIILEKGQPRGFEAVAEVRDRLLEEFIIPPGGEAPKIHIGEETKSRAHVRVKEPGMIVAPCTNHRKCPMYLEPGTSKGRKDFCRFSQRFVRPPFLQTIMGATVRNHDDVQFSYVAVQRGGAKAKELAAVTNATSGKFATERAFRGYEDAETAPDMLSLPRQILPPIKRRGHVTLDVCTPNATLERWTVPKSFSRQAYHDARKAKWGDLWALGAKTRNRRNVRLGRAEAKDDGGVRAQRAKAAEAKRRKPIEVGINEGGVVGNPEILEKMHARRVKSSKKGERDALKKQFYEAAESEMRD